MVKHAGDGMMIWVCSAALGHGRRFVIEATINLAV